MKLKIKNDKLKRNIKNQIKKLFILLLLIPNITIAGSSNIVITKIAAFEKSGYEWVEICNRSGGAVDTNGWKFYENEINHGWGELRDDQKNIIHREDLVLASGECAVIVQDENKFLENNENWNSTIIDSAWGSLKEAGEEIGIKDAGGEIVEMFTYIVCKDGVLERVDINLDDYSALNWVEHGTHNMELITHDEMTGDVTVDAGGTDNEVPRLRSAPLGMTGEEENESVIRENPFLIREELLNNPPVAVMGSDLEINIGDTVFFDGSDSFDEDGDELEYFWDFGDGDEGEGIKIEHTYIHSGKMSAILRVCDGGFTSSSAIWINAVATKYAEHIFINAFLPNPIGPDTKDEWIEICNDGSEMADLSNWILDDIADGGSKAFLIKNVEISPEKCFRFMRSDTKIAINNNGDDVRLLNPAGDVADQISFDKKAESGEVFYKDEDIQHVIHNIEQMTSDEVGTQVLYDELESQKVYKVERTTDVTDDVAVYYDIPDVVQIEVQLPMAVRTGDVWGGTLNDEIVKISGNVIEKSGNIFFIDDGSGEIRIQILPKTKIKYTDINIGDQITIDGEVSETQVGYRVLPDLIEKK